MKDSLYTAHNIAVTKTARYFVSTPGEKPTRILIACHGYAHGAAAFFEEIIEAVPPDVLLVAPEGLSRFYRRGFAGEVVASWMTAEDRLNEIQDHCAYLEQLVTELHQTYPDLPVVVMGFSQGVATVCRWVAQSVHPPFDAMILWAGTPPEPSYMEVLDQKVAGQIHWIAGTSDLFISDEKIATLSNYFRNLTPKSEIHSFEGGHHMDVPLLRKILTQ
jgi:predicted esterase